MSASAVLSNDEPTGGAAPCEEVVVFVRLATSFVFDPVILSLSADARWLYVKALCVAKQWMTDGFAAAALLEGPGVPDLEASAEELVDAGLFEVREDGWFITAWFKHNLSADEIRSRRVISEEEYRDSKRRAGKRSGEVRRAARDARLSEQPNTCSTRVRCVPAVQLSGVEQDEHTGASALRGNDMNTNTRVPCSPKQAVELEKSSLDLYRTNMVSVSVSENTAVRTNNGCTQEGPAEDVVPDYEPDDPLYELDERYNGYEDLLYWERHISPIQPPQKLMAQNTLCRLHTFCKLSKRQIRALITHIATNKDARIWWGVGKSPATWFRRSDGVEPLWLKIKANWAANGGELPAPVVRKSSVPKPSPDPDCDCNRGWREDEDGQDVPCSRCPLGVWHASQRPRPLGGAK